MKLKKTCFVCEKTFTAKSNKGLYCSVSCRMVAFRTRNSISLTQKTRFANLSGMKDEILFLDNLQQAMAEQNKILHDKYNALVQDYNKLVKEFEAKNVRES